MSTAFVLSGGGSLGAVQVGMLQALSDHGIEPDLLVGTSAGAMNAAWVAGHGTSPASLAGLESVWTRLRRSDVFPLDARAALRGLLGRSPALTSPTRLRDLVAACASVERLEEAAIPVHLVTADGLLPVRSHANSRARSRGTCAEQERHSSAVRAFRLTDRLSGSPRRARPFGGELDGADDARQ